MRRIGILVALWLAAMLLSASCRREPVPMPDASVETDSGSERDPTGLYEECSLSEGCESAGQVCRALSGLTRQAALCTFLCSSNAGCPSSQCAYEVGADDERPYCSKLCPNGDSDCPAGFECLVAALGSPAGNIEREICFPR